MDYKIILTISITAIILISPASAEMNDLSEVENGNVRLALDNLKDLIDGFKEHEDELDLSEIDADLNLERLEHILQNLENKLKNGKIKSVPGLDKGNDGKKGQYRHNDGTRWVEANPKGAYCDSNTQIWNGETDQWENCEPGTIILDPSVLDPKRIGSGNKKDDGTLDESKVSGWEAKWTLLHILVHEKMHEVMINEQIEKIEERKGSKPTNDEIEEAERSGGTPEKHGQVYDAQKALLKLKIKVTEKEVEELKKQRDELREERSDLKKELREAKREKPQDQNKIDRLEAELEMLKDRIEEIKDEIKKKEREAGLAKRLLGKMIEKLQNDKRRAMGEHFRQDYRHCSSSFDGFNTGKMAVLVTFPAGYELYHLDLLKGEVMNLDIIEGEFYGELIIVSDTLMKEQEPDYFVQMTEQTFSGLLIQPEVCDFLEYQKEIGDLQTSEEPFGKFLQEKSPTQVEKLVDEIDELEMKLEEREIKIDQLEDEQIKLVDEIADREENQIGSLPYIVLGIGIALIIASGVIFAKKR